MATKVYGFRHQTRVFSPSKYAVLGRKVPWLGVETMGFSGCERAAFAVDLTFEIFL